MLILDYKDRRPIYEQVTDKLQGMIYRGILKCDEQLPSVRSLAMELSINPNTIQRAYTELERKGFIYSIKGKGNFVAPISDISDAKVAAVMERYKSTVSQAMELGIAKDILQKEFDYIYDHQKLYNRETEDKI